MARKCHLPDPLRPNTLSYKLFAKAASRVWVSKFLDLQPKLERTPLTTDRPIAKERDPLRDEGLSNGFSVVSPSWLN